MKKKTEAIIIFILCFISFLITFKLFINIGISSDELGTSPSIICGGDFWQMMNWLRLILLFFLSVWFGFRIFSPNKN